LENKPITKFKLRGYNPKKIPDIQLRDDWRLVVAKYATMRRGGKTEFANLDEVLAFGERVLRELISRFDAFTIHYENYRSPESREFLIRLLKRIVKKGLLLVEPHARWIWEGKKSLMVKKKKFDLLEPRWLVSTEGTVYGVIRFHPAKEISLEDFEKLQKRHLISEEERREWWGEAKKFFAYEFKDFVPLEEPQTIRVPRGAQTFLERLLLKGVKQPFSWWGGKNLIAKAIVSLIPDHEIYCEPFAGAAAVFFQKPRAKIEVLNDLDPEVVFLLRAIRDLSSDDFSKLKRYDWKGSRKRFEELKRKKPRTRLGKLYRFLYLNAFSYLGDPRGFSTFRIDRFRSSFDLEKIQNCSVRLKNTKILNQDYKKIVKRFDSPQTFFYFDPPYPGFFQAQWRHQFSEKDEEELLEILSKLKGKFILSYPYSKRKNLQGLDFTLKVLS
jgi:DNA adenine methylase